jgi:hypothetical protein
VRERPRCCVADQRGPAWFGRRRQAATCRSAMFRVSSSGRALRVAWAMSSPPCTAVSTVSASSAGSARRWQIEKAFRMSKHELQARRVYHRKRDSIEAHLTIVFAALAISRWIEHRTGWSIRKFVKTARRYRTVEIQAGPTSSPPPTRSPTTSARHSKRSPIPPDLRTDRKVTCLRRACGTVRRRARMIG